MYSLLLRNFFWSDSILVQWEKGKAWLNAIYIYVFEGF